MTLDQIYSKIKKFPFTCYYYDKDKNKIHLEVLSKGKQFYRCRTWDGASMSFSYLVKKATSNIYRYKSPYEIQSLVPSKDKGKSKESVSGGKHKCNCDFVQLLQIGCKCGGV